MSIHTTEHHRAINKLKYSFCTKQSPIYPKLKKKRHNRLCKKGKKIKEYMYLLM